MTEKEARFQLRTLDLAYCALFTALMAACAWISVPVPKPFVPFTMQTFAVFAAVMTLGGRRGFYSVLAYLLLGAAGAPVFSGFRGGLGVLLGNTGGYLIGFIALALVYWFMTAFLGDRPAIRITACAAGLIACYAFGTAWFLLAGASGSMGLLSALGLCVFPFLVPDAVKLALAAALSARLRKNMK